jgi:hypothetical protein
MATPNAMAMPSSNIMGRQKQIVEEKPWTLAGSSDT